MENEFTLDEMINYMRFNAKADISECANEDSEEICKKWFESASRYNAIATALERLKVLENK